MLLRGDIIHPRRSQGKGKRSRGGGSRPFFVQV